MSVQVRLNTTTQHGSRFLQQWTIIDHDGSEHAVVTDSEWGDYSCEEGGDRVFLIESSDGGRLPCRADQIIGICVSAVPGPTLDGETATLDTDWLDEVEASGVPLESLQESV